MHDPRDQVANGSRLAHYLCVRSEVEQFFVEALEQVKLEKAKKLEADKQQIKAEQARQLREYAGVCFTCFRADD